MIVVVLLLCFFSSIISLTVVRRALAAGAARRRGLVLGGCLTGASIWSTHFAAMLAYEPGIEVRYDALAAVASLVLACLVAAAGWLMLDAPGRRRGALAGGVVGIALLIAHFLDMSALRVGGLVRYDPDLILLAIAVGLPLCILAGALLQREERTGIPLLAGLCLGCGVLVLHFVAMAAVTIIPGPVLMASRLDLGLNGLTAMVIAASAVILVAAFGLAYHDQDLARATAEDRARLHQSEENYRYSIELNPQIPWTADPQGRLIEIGPRWSEFSGQPTEEALSAGLRAYVHPDDRPTVYTLWERALRTGDAALDTRYRLRDAAGIYHWFRVRGQARRDADGAVVKWYGNVENIDDQVNAELALRASEERYRLASRATNDVIWDWLLATDRVEWSGAAETVLGYPQVTAGTSLQWWVDRVHPEDRAEVIATRDRILIAGLDHWTNEFRFLSGSGRYLDLLSRVFVVRDDQGKAVRLIGSMVDITARKRGEEELRWAANHDALTKLPNRKLFTACLEKALDEARPRALCVGLIVLDLDRFKTLNDTLGHLAGDALLREVASRLAHRAPPGATVARLGGDEFAIILPRLLPDEARTETAEAMLLGIDIPLVHDERWIEISISAGAAMFPRDGTMPEELLKSADLALYSAKAEGPGRIRGFVPAMREAAEREKTMLYEAREALGDDRIVPFYQPKVSLETGRITGFEALLRWHSHLAELQPPGALLAAFSDGQLSVQLTDRMLDRIIADMATWRAQGVAFERIAVNGSAEDFRTGDFSDRILGRLARAGVPGSCLELEVTESVFLGKETEAVERTLRTLRAEGVTIALDDFGTGYASLIHLTQFPVDTIKIDQSFVSRMMAAEQDDATAIVGALIDLAKNLGIATVAEGIETTEQAELLWARGCDQGQGFLFGRAMARGLVPGLIEGWDAAMVFARRRATSTAAETATNIGAG